MKQLQAAMIIKKEDNNYINADTKILIGAGKYQGEIVFGMYSTDTWNTRCMPETIHIKEQDHQFGTKIAVYYHNDDLKQKDSLVVTDMYYIALQQRIDDNIIAITPIAGIYAELELYKTYYFEV